MTKAELIRALDGLDDDIEVVIVDRDPVPDFKFEFSTAYLPPTRTRPVARFGLVVPYLRRLRGK